MRFGAAASQFLAISKKQRNKRFNLVFIGFHWRCVRFTRLSWMWASFSFAYQVSASASNFIIYRRLQFIFLLFVELVRQYKPISRNSCFIFFGERNILITLNCKWKLMMTAHKFIACLNLNWGWPFAELRTLLWMFMHEQWRDNGWTSLWCRALDQLYWFTISNERQCQRQNQMPTKNIFLVSFFNADANGF